MNLCRRRHFLWKEPSLKVRRPPLARPAQDLKHPPCVDNGAGSTRGRPTPEFARPVPTTLNSDLPTCLHPPILPSSPPQTPGIAACRTCRHWGLGTLAEWFLSARTDPQIMLATCSKHAKWGVLRMKFRALESWPQTRQRLGQRECSGRAQAILAGLFALPGPATSRTERDPAALVEQSSRAWRAQHITFPEFSLQMSARWLSEARFGVRTRPGPAPTGSIAHSQVHVRKPRCGPRRAESPPPGWPQVCLSETTAYTRNYVNTHNYRRALEALRHHPTVAAELERWIWRLHADSDSESPPSRERAGSAVAAAARQARSRSRSCGAALLAQRSAGENQMHTS